MSSSPETADGLWQVSLCLSPEEAGAAALVLGLAGALSVSQEGTDEGRWRVEGLFAGRPGEAVLRDMLAAVVAFPAGPDSLSLSPVLPRDWVRVVQENFPPVREGRFLVCSRAAAASGPAGPIGLVIDAGLAFGTGHHESTLGCLRLLRARAPGSFRRVLDVGTGTGILAVAALKTGARLAVAADIDPVAVRVARENFLVNRVCGWHCVQADGTRHRLVRAMAPYDLVLANILADPLVRMAPQLARVTAPGGTVIVAGILERQASRVLRALGRAGLVLSQRVRPGGWWAMSLRRRRQ